MRPFITTGVFTVFTRENDGISSLIELHLGKGIVEYANGLTKYYFFIANCNPNLIPNKKTKPL